MAKMDEAEASMARTLEEKTGKSLDAWIGEGPKDADTELIAWLRRAYDAA